MKDSTHNKIVDIAVQELETLTALLKAGAITDAMFDKKAKKVKDRMFKNFFNLT
jgi:hypothetical protein